MRHSISLLMAMAVAASLVIVGCTQAAPTPTPTKAAAVPTKAAEPTKPAAAAATAAPTKAAEPTKAPTAAPTAAPAKVDFPQKGKTITVIVPLTAGGSTDLNARLIASWLEKDLGTPVQVLNKPGAGAQIGLTELAQSKPDGYTMGYTNLPAVVGIYLDPERKAAFDRKSFEPIATIQTDLVTIAVQPDSPFKTLKDLIDAAKAKPDSIRVATAGIMSTQHIGTLILGKAAGAQFAVVHFDGGGPAVTALLGGHTEAAINLGSEYLALHKDGKVRVLGVMGSEESPYFPGIKTVESQGYKAHTAVAMSVSAPAGTPKEIVNLLSASIKKGLATDDLRKKLADIGQTPAYMDPAQLAAYWADMEGQIKPLMEMVKR